jgi:hypothetical protein
MARSSSVEYGLPFFAPDADAGMNGKLSCCTAIALLLFCASTWSEPEDSLPAQQENHKPVATEASDAQPVASNPAIQAVADPGKGAEASAVERRDATGRGLTLHQKRIFVLGLTKQENQ